MSFLPLWKGCSKVSRGCKYCFAEWKSWSGDSRVRKDTNFDHQLESVKRLPKGILVLICPTSDFFSPEADGWRADVWRTVRDNPQIEFVVQTKRIKRVHEVLPDDWDFDGLGFYPNVTFNATLDDPKYSDERLDVLLNLSCRRRGVAICPMTCEPWDVEWALKTKLIPQGYLTGENGNPDTVRPLRYEWVVEMKEQFEKTRTHFDFKTTGTRWIRDGVETIENSCQHSKAKMTGLHVIGDGEYVAASGNLHVDELVRPDGSTIVPVFGLYKVGGFQKGENDWMDPSWLTR